MFKARRWASVPMVWLALACGSGTEGGRGTDDQESDAGVPAAGGAAGGPADASAAGGSGGGSSGSTGTSGAGGVGTGGSGGGAPSVCADGTKNGNEADVDCGGRCLPCGIGATCTIAPDCVSG